jgi:sugar lactone lactonase YvrE
MRGLLNRVRHGSRLTKALMVLAAVLVLGGAGFGILELVGGQPWVDQPVLLRPLEGDVRFGASAGSSLATARDQKWLFVGGTVRTDAGSLAVLQYFDGSAVQIVGEADVTQVRSQSVNGKAFSAARSIALKVTRGEVTVNAMRQDSASGVFEVEAPGSVGVAQGTAFRVEVDDDKSVVWQSSGGTVRVAAITPGPNGEARIALIKLDAGEAVTLPPVPSAWLGTETYGSMMARAGEIARAAAGAGQSDVAVGGATLVEANPRSGNAVYAVEAAPAKGAAAPFLPGGYALVEDSLVGREAPNLLLGRREFPVGLGVPAVCLDDLWEDVEPTPRVRTAPPRYEFSIYDVLKPLGVAVDPIDGRIFITESDGERATRVFDADGERLMTLIPPDTDVNERSPVYVAIDGMGTAYVSDRSRHVVDMYDVNGDHLGTFQPGADLVGVWSPLAVMFDDCGNLFLSDVSGSDHRILMFDRSGRMRLEISGEGRDALAFPNGVAVDGEGRIYVADSNNYRLQVFESDGEFVGEVPGQTFPRGIGIRGRYLYVVDTFGHNVNTYDLEQGLRPAFAFGVQGVGDGQFNFPNGLALDSAGRVYVTDRENNRLQVWGY